MGTHISRQENGWWLAYYTDDKGVRHNIGDAPTKDAMLHRLIGIIKSLDEDSPKP